jgi:hypothetical protein
LESSKSKGQHTVIGGKTILGKIFTYQEKTGMKYQDIMKLPYIAFVIGMMDAPQIDYDSKKEQEIKPKTVDDEASALVGCLS